MSRVFFLLALAACVESEAPTENSAAASWVFDDGVQWMPMTTYSIAPANNTMEAYARAVARLRGPTLPNGNQPLATGALISDDTIITAEHFQQGGGSTMTAVFGIHGPNDDSWADLEGRRRLVRLGLPPSEVDDIDFLDFTQWDCNIAEEFATRDVAFWTCAPNPLVIEIDGTSMLYLLYPGHVWGRVKSELNAAPATGVGLTSPTINYGCDPSMPLGADVIPRMLVAAGTVTSPVVPCAPSQGASANTNNGECYATKADALPTSSGGPVLNDSYDLIGLVQGQSALGPLETGDWCTQVAGSSSAYNINTTVYAWDLDPYLQPNSSDPVGDVVGVTDGVGAASGPGQDLQCPTDMLVAGIVGTTLADGRVGNFGVVCAADGGAVNHQLDTAIVRTAGSSDTPGITDTTYELQPFLAEQRSTEFSGYHDHQLAMCPPGFFVDGIRAYATGHIKSITKMFCVDPDNGLERTVLLDTPWLGAIGTSTGGTASTIRCAGTESVWGGAVVRNVGPGTSYIRGVCQNED